MCLALIGLVLGMLMYKMSRVPVLSEAELREQGVVILPQPREVQPFALDGADGSSFTRDDLAGAWTFAFFGFANCPDICPLSMAEISKAYRSLQADYPERAKQFRGMLVSVDPDRDTPEIISQYVGAFSPDFVGLTGERTEIARFATSVNVAFGNVPDGQGGYTVDHTGNIVVFNPYGHYHGFIKMPHRAETVREAFLALQEKF